MHAEPYMEIINLCEEEFNQKKNVEYYNLYPNLYYTHRTYL